MARPLRLEFPGAAYHITSRGNAREDIYLDDTDRMEFLAILSDTVDRYNWLCHAYCLMGNHYHLLIETPDPNLSMGMRQLNGVYTQFFNRHHKRVGHVFQGRYKAILVEKDSHLLELCRYIVLNPVQIVKRPKGWRWSSYKATVGARKPPDFLTTDWVLGQFSPKKAEAKRRYEAFVEDGRSAKSPWQGIKGQIYFGGSRFRERMQELLGAKQKMGEIPRAQRYPGRPPLPEIFQDVKGKQARDRQAVAAHVTYGYSLQQIAEALGVHYTTVSKIVKRARG